MIKKLALLHPLTLIVAASAALVTISACTAEPAAPPPGTTAVDKGEYTEDRIVQQDVKLDDGRTVKCLVFYGYRKGGLSCDWEAAK